MKIATLSALRNHPHILLLLKHCHFPTDWPRAKAVFKVWINAILCCLLEIDVVDLLLKENVNRGKVKMAIWTCMLKTVKRLPVSSYWLIFLSALMYYFVQQHKNVGCLFCKLWSFTIKASFSSGWACLWLMDYPRTIKFWCIPLAVWGVLYPFGTPFTLSLWPSSTIVMQSED